MRVDGAALAIVAAGLLTLPTLRAIDDVEHHGPYGRPHGKQLALGAQKTSETSTLSANDLGRAHKDLPAQGI
jgi:hypothetical protein